VGFLDTSPAELLSLALKLTAVPSRLRDPRGGGKGVLRLRVGVARGKVAVGRLGTRGHSLRLVGGAAATAELLQQECQPGEIRVQRSLARRPEGANFVFASVSPLSPPKAAVASAPGSSAPAVLLVAKM
jgi:class 3 adenylate cyclase